jgi:hypothetical protein
MVVHEGVRHAVLPAAPSKLVGMLVLPEAALAETGEAALGQVLSSFTDPEAEGSERRWFGSGRER